MNPYRRVANFPVTVIMIFKVIFLSFSSLPVILLGLPKAVLFLEGEVEMLVAQPRVASQGVCVWKCRRAFLG